MTGLDQVRRLVERLSPVPICDDCITERLGLSERQQANALVRALAGTRGFERRKGLCAMCGREQPSIRYRGP